MVILKSSGFQELWNNRLASFLAIFSDEVFHLSEEQLAVHPLARLGVRSRMKCNTDQTKVRHTVHITKHMIDNLENFSEQRHYVQNNDNNKDDDKKSDLNEGDIPGNDDYVGLHDTLRCCWNAAYDDSKLIAEDLSTFDCPKASTVDFLRNENECDMKALR